MLDRTTIERMACEAGPVVIGLSGGGDSVALLHLLKEALGAARLRAAIVDHGLREGSDARAQGALRIAEHAGVGAVKLGPLQPAGGASQQQARRLRYRLLCDHARQVGARVIAVAHNADDQAETVFMRAGAGSGWRGIAGMAALDTPPLWPEGRDLMLARPLLGARRAALREFLRDRDSGWIEDPANEDFAYERVRTRARLAALERAGFDPMRLVRLAARLRVLADEVDAQARALIARAARFEAGAALIARADWVAAEAVRRRALSALICAAAGAEREAEAGAVARLEAQIGTIGFRGAALGGAAIAPWGEGVRIGRDPGAVSGRAGVAPAPALTLPAGAEVVWDGRLLLCAAVAGLRLEPAPAPSLSLAGAMRDLAEAEQAGWVRAKWLTELHAQRRLGLL